MRLGDLATDVARPRGGRVVKLLGDGVLLRFDDAPAAVEGALDLLLALPGAGLPSGHAGIASGPLIARDGDVFGRTVNLAARIADAAPDGRAWVPEPLAGGLPAGRFRLAPTDGRRAPGDRARAPGRRLEAGRRGMSRGDGPPLSAGGRRCPRASR